MRDVNIIIPVYNEERIIKEVVEEWIDTLNELKIDYLIKVYNDGSTDNTLTRLNELKHDYPVVLEVIDKKNEGHGPTIIRGYQESHDSEWVFQLDSDNEISASYFVAFWNSRNEYDFILGKRLGRGNSYIRIIMSKVSSWLVAICYGNGVNDVNSPFRLFRNEVFIPHFQQIPDSVFAPNIILSGVATKNKMRIKSIVVNNVTNTKTASSLGESKYKLFKISWRSFTEVVQYAFKTRS